MCGRLSVYFYLASFINPFLSGLRQYGYNTFILMRLPAVEKRSVPQVRPHRKGNQMLNLRYAVYHQSQNRQWFRQAAPHRGALWVANHD